MDKYAIGVDFGTQSGRVLLVNATSGEEIGVSVKEYSHGVMDEKLPCGALLPPDWALQHPADYFEVLGIIPDLLKKEGISAEDVIGLGIDFTACTVMPVYENGDPLCFNEKNKKTPHAYVKLWKHHAAQDEANKLNEIAEKTGEEFLSRYGGKISSEWLVPKVWQVLNEDPEIYYEADKFIEAADWVIWQLTGNERRNSCTAGYKAIWSKKHGYPSDGFFNALDPRLKNIVKDKLSNDIFPIGSRAGYITEAASKLTGLTKNTAVTVANVDAHVTAPAMGIVSPGKMFIIMGTSSCHMILGEEEKIVPGMCGVVEDGIIPGYAAFEAGQCCVGDHFEWFVENCVPRDYFLEAEKNNEDIHAYLSKKAEKLRPGESGLIALDWWNGNRSVLVDADLTGLIIGQTLATKPEEIYRALIEATAFGTRIIIETFIENGVTINELYACGGIAEKNNFLMRIYSDVTGKEIKISASSQAPALGSAMFGAVAAGEAAGGYDNIFDAAKVMAKIKDETYKPNAENKLIYDLLYEEYRALHDYFGRGGNEIMKRLKKIKNRVSGDYA